MTTATASPVPADLTARIGILINAVDGVNEAVLAAISARDAGTPAGIRRTRAARAERARVEVELDDAVEAAHAALGYDQDAINAWADTIVR